MARIKSIGRRVKALRGTKSARSKAMKGTESAKVRGIRGSKSAASTDDMITAANAESGCKCSPFCFYRFCSCYIVIPVMLRWWCSSKCKCIPAVGDARCLGHHCHHVLLLLVASLAALAPLLVVAGAPLKWRSKIRYTCAPKMQE